MSRKLGLWVLVTAGSLLIATPVALAALTPEVVDAAGFFGANATREANQVIKEIKDRYHKDLLIETYKTVPADKEAMFKDLDKRGQDRFFAEWGRDRAKFREVNGIYILICRDPGHLQIEVGNETEKRVFTLRDRDHLKDLMLEAFKKKDYDRALLEGVAYVQKVMSQNVGRSASGAVPLRQPGAPRVQQGPNLGGWLCTGLMVVLGIWLVLGLFRAFSGGGGGYGGPGYGYGGGGWGGGGFFSGLMGGLFGAAAGSWMYDSFFRNNYDGGGGWNDTSAMSGGDVGGPQDTDYSGTGGDFGDAGGGDFGGGGGDFGGGGGDFGGGGGDFGGGGGDF